MRTGNSLQEVTIASGFERFSGDRVWFFPDMAIASRVCHPLAVKSRRTIGSDVPIVLR
ncbi:MAG: hypothetical protein SWY16_18985 [Cyanobacteriota bacterium]|nr:hypothetical protein [Cyanobacteriota bacterium]